AMMRSNVDLPQPERPSSATISLSRRVRFTLSSTTWSAAPLGPYMWLRCSISTSGVVVARTSIGTVQSVEPEATFGETIERPPQQPVDQHHEQRHHADAQHDARIVAGLRRFGDIGAEPGGLELDIAPIGHFRNDAGVPRAARRGERACHV